jgi:hypothetical protein
MKQEIIKYKKCLDTEEKQHILKIIDILYNECVSAGGDGDAMWYSEYYDIDTLYPLVEEYNNSLKFPFKVAKDELTISWYDGQEYIIITNDKKVYDERPGWSQFVIAN